MSEKIMPKLWNDLEVLEEIGAGSFGKVYMVKDSQSRISAVKVVNIPNQDAELQTIRKEYGSDEFVRNYFTKIVDDFEHEIDTMKQLEHEINVVHLEKFHIDSNPDDFRWTIYLKMEFLKDLPSYIKEHEMTEEEVIKLAMDLCQALIACENKKIIHRDIKPDNILVDEAGNYKLGDFGIARYVEKTMNTLSKKGTFYYMAPEIFHGLKYGAEVDIYSLGLVLFRLMNKGRDPFVDTKKRMIYYKDRSNALEERMSGKMIPKPVEASEEFGEIIRKCLAYDIEKRYRSAKALYKDLQALQKGTFKAGTYIVDDEYVDQPENERKKSFRKKLGIAIGVVILGLAAISPIRTALIDYGYLSIPMDDEEGARPATKGVWEAPKVEIDGDVTEDEIINLMESYNDTIWEELSTGDSDSFTKHFPEYDSDDFQTIYDYHYLLENEKDPDKRDKYLSQYQNNGKTYAHIISQQGDIYYGEVNRFYIQDTESQTNPYEFYSGVLLQSSMFYRIDYSDLENPVIKSIPYYVDLSQQSNQLADGDQDYIAQRVSLLSYDFIQEIQGRYYMVDESGYMNYLFMENDFTYESYFRANVVISFVNEKENTISFIVNAKNGREEPVTIKDASIRYENIKGLDYSDKDINWTIDAGQSQCYVLTFDLGEKITADDINEAGRTFITFNTDI